MITTLTIYGLPGQTSSFTAKGDNIPTTGVSSRLFKRILPFLKNKDMNWAGSYTGVLVIDNPDIYPITLYIDQERSYILYIDQEKEESLER